MNGLEIMPSPQKFFLLIGAPKSGTTAIASWLTKRPDIRMSPHKEPRFFTDFAQIPWAGPNGVSFGAGVVTGEETYLASFGDCAAQDWVIDASTDYLWCQASPDLIRDWAQRYQVKVACILRDPVARAVSEYEHTVRDLLEKESFLSSLEQEEARFEAHWLPLFYHVRRSRYYEAVCRYRELFGEDFLLLDYGELSAPETLGRKIENFLGLPAQKITAPPRENVAAGYRSGALARAGKNETLLGGLRAVVPKGLRGPIRRFVERLNKAPHKYRPTEQELQFLHNALAEDMRKCRDDPYFPTESW